MESPEPRDWGAGDFFARKGALIVTETDFGVKGECRMKDYVAGFLEFAEKSPTAFHAVKNACEMLEEKGFSRLYENTVWQIVPGGKYYVTRNLSAVIAFTVPEEGFGAFQIVASHGDSPTFKLKPLFEEKVCGCYTRLNVEKYGGMICSSWLDRPLSVAGRVIVREGDGLAPRLVDLDRDSVLIPNMPIHFNREINDGYKYNPQVDMLPLYGDGDAAGKLMDEVAEACGTQADRIVGADLFLYNRAPGSVWGADDAYFSCGRIDDLECAWTSLVAFTQCVTEGHINVCAVLDNEEVGSGSKQGANSTFLRDVLTRIGNALGASDEEIRAAMASGFMVSADNAHAVHPNHPEKFDADNRVMMNKGVVIKSNANQRYTTDGVSQAVFATVCSRAGVPVQTFANRSDTPGGSTLGNISNAHVSMNTVDIGLAQLAMHSAYETAGTKDPEYMVKALEAFWNTAIVMDFDGKFILY